MGDWHISIRGTGAHHNKHFPSDANRLAKNLVQQLREAGHHVKSAVFTHGGEEDLTHVSPAPPKQEMQLMFAEIERWGRDRDYIPVFPIQVAPEKIELCARAAHEMNRVYCLSLGDTSQLPWEQAPDWMKESAMKGVLGILSGNTPEQSHASWLKDRESRGWKYGPVKDEEKKEHPCFVPYHELPAAQQHKDVLFRQTVLSLAAALNLSF